MQYAGYWNSFESINFILVFIILAQNIKIEEETIETIKNWLEQKSEMDI